MNEIYTDLEEKVSPIQNVIDFVAQQFNLPYGNSLSITIRLPKDRIIELSRQMIEQGKKAGLVVQSHELNNDEFIFTKYTLPYGKIEFIDNGE